MLNPAAIAIAAAGKAPSSGKAQSDEQPGGERGGGDVQFGAHQDRRLSGEHVADDAADAGGHHPHRERRNRRDSIAQRLGGAVSRISGEPGSVEPQQCLARKAAAARHPDQQGRADTDQQGRIGVDPEHRCPDQQVAQGAAADAGDDGEEKEGDQSLPLFGGEQRAGDREHADAEIVEPHEGHGDLRQHGHEAYIRDMADETKTPPIPTLEDWQHWTLVMGRAQQMLMEFWADSLKKDQPFPAWSPGAFGFGEAQPASDPMALMSAGAQAWAKGLETWGKMLGGVTAAPASGQPERKDRRFAAPEWRDNPIFDTIRQTYLRVSDQLLGTVDEIDGLDAEAREKLRFATRSFVDAMSPSNFALTNPQVLKRTIDTRGDNLLKGLANMLKDIASGQVTQTKPGVFEVGRNLAMTPGKVVRQTPLYQLIQYTPTTPEVLTTPVVIFPPWINRFYILDLTAEKSFVRWCVDNGISLVHG